MGRVFDLDVIGERSAPAVLLLHPWWGVTKAVRWWAEQLAAAGRRVVVPDLYDGQVAETVDEARDLQDRMDEKAAVAFVERCADDLGTDGTPYAAMGFSMGATYACLLGGRGATSPAEIVAFYGGWKPRGEDVRTRVVQLHLVPDDEYCSDDEVAYTTESFSTFGVPVETHVYEGAGHWFAEPGSPAYDEAATELARTRVLALIGARS